MSLEIISFFENESFTWTYLVADTHTGKAAIVDPVWVYDSVSGGVDRAFTEKVLARAGENGWQVEWVLETHAHADHLSSGGLIRSETGARIAIGKGIRTVQETFRKVYNLKNMSADGSQFDRLMAEGDEIQLGDLTIRVMETPGHTPDSITLVVGDAAFIGDTLFAPGFGSARCDFPGGDASSLYDSIQRLYGLPGDTRLFLCHDYPKDGAEPRSIVTVDESRRENIHVQEGTQRQEFIDMRESRDATLSLPKLILPAIQVNILGGAAPPPESNGFSYLKIPFNTGIPEILNSGK
jgi:glyoxylase-like metal-dependent hydrolase (beta-lactamase superfamily II)